MTYLKLEYIWVGGNNELRSKTKVLKKTLVNDNTLKPEELPEWNYDGSSTNQATGEDSEVLLKPVAVYNDPFRGENSFFVLCDTWLPNGEPHPTNTRVSAKEIFDKALDKEPWFGMEQEFFVMDVNTNLPLGFPNNGFPNPQGQYYCSVGASNAYGREFFEEALDNCLKAGLPVTGTNFEVCAGQLEIQVCSTGISQGDNLLVTRYILQRTGEKYNLNVDFRAKPVKGDWNGSGCHTNFSTKEMRENENGYELILEAIEKLRVNHKLHIESYGNDNHERLTGLHETAHYSQFSSGVANRGASIRIPRTSEKHGKGYFEDRRPSSSCDPYVVTSLLFKTCCL
jgi:glutamine synthetase